MREKTPPFFLGLILLFWGWQHQLLSVAICLCLIVESIHFFKFRFVFEPEDFNKFIDISIVFLAGTIVIALSVESQKAIFILLRWLPVIFFPIIAAQQFSTKGKIDIRAFFLVGKKKNHPKVYDVKQINVSYYYALIVLLSAGMTKSDGHGFYAGISLFFFWALWGFSWQRTSRFFWVLCFFVVIFSGFWGHQTIHRISVKTRMWVISYFADYYNGNPFKTSTALGDIGALKLSDVIVFRVKKLDEKIAVNSMLIQNATYNIFGKTTWYARAKFEAVESGADKKFWQIHPPIENLHKMIIYSRLRRNKAVLNLPAGAVSIAHMKVGNCEKNAMQSIRVEEGPSFINSLVSYTGKLSYDAAPYASDLMIPDKERAGVQKIVKDLDLENLLPDQILKTLKHYFSSRYTYSLELKGKGDFETPLQNFLHHTKAGHCEFFATAAALILRQVDLPTRYVTGFIAHEYSRLEDFTVVRHRDAHAWVKVYINGRWENFDATPASFLLTDIQATPGSVIADMVSYLRFKLFQLRHETGKKIMGKYGFWLILPLGILLYFRLKKSNTIKQTKISEKKVNSMKSVDDSFCLIEKLLQKKGYPKYSHETYGAWYGRVVHCFDDAPVRQRFLNIIFMYNKWRFSRLGINHSQKVQFDADIESIIKEIKSLS